MSWSSIFLQKSDKSQIFYWSSQTALGSGSCSIDGLSPCSKTWKRPYFRHFQPDTEYFLPLLPYTDLVPPSIDPVPPSTNLYRRILTQYHHVSTSIWIQNFRFRNSQIVLYRPRFRRCGSRHGSIDKSGLQSLPWYGLIYTPESLAQDPPTFHAQER